MCHNKHDSAISFRAKLKYCTLYIITYDANLTINREKGRERERERETNIIFN